MAAESGAASSRPTGARLRVTQTRSVISHIGRNRGTIRALGLQRIGDTVEVPDNNATRGMVRQVRFLVEVEEIAAAGDAASAAGKPPSSTSKPSAPTSKPAPEEQA
jgi:large subunit ribosomal protein L30